MNTEMRESVITKCYSCGDQITVTKRSIADNGNQVYCENCLIKTNCSHCGLQIQTTHKIFEQYNGSVICNSCEDNPANSSHPDPDMDKTDVFGRRVIAAIIDLLLPFAFLILLGMILDMFLSEPGSGGDFFVGMLLIGAFGFNFVYLEAKTGQSMGKEIMGIMVAKKDGSSCTLGSAIIRNILRPIDLLGGYFVGFMSMAVTSNDQRLGDCFAGTVVVRVKD